MPPLADAHTARGSDMEYDAPVVLLVEGNPLLAEITAFRLELLGYQVDQVRSGEEAMEAAERRMPDVIIVDLILPGVHGIDLTNRLSNDRRTSMIPVMVISHVAEMEDVQRAFTAGAKDYLVVPYDPITLERKLASLLQQAGKVL